MTDLPQIILEYTSNVTIETDWGEMLQTVDDMVRQASGTIVRKQENKVLEHTRYYRDEPGSNKGYVHVEVVLSDEMSATMKRELGNTILIHLQTQLLPENMELELQLVVEVCDNRGKECFVFPRNRKDEK